MQKIESSYNPLPNALSMISNFNEIDQSTPILEWEKTPGQQFKKSQFQLFNTEFHAQNLSHWRFFRFKNQKSYPEIYYFC
jgi:hypothetical protein